VTAPGMRSRATDGAASPAPGRCPRPPGTSGAGSPRGRGRARRGSPDTPAPRPPRPRRRRGRGCAAASRAAAGRSPARGNRVRPRRWGRSPAGTRPRCAASARAGRSARRRHQVVAQPLVQPGFAAGGRRRRPRGRHRGGTPRDRGRSPRGTGGARSAACGRRWPACPGPTGSCRSGIAAARDRASSSRRSDSGQSAAGQRDIDPAHGVIFPAETRAGRLLGRSLRRSGKGHAGGVPDGEPVPGRIGRAVPGHEKKPPGGGRNVPAGSCGSAESVGAQGETRTPTR
jgi:hypothetical protein